MVWWWKRTRNKYIKRNDENENDSTLTNIIDIHEKQTNELFYKLFVNSVIEDINCNEEFTYEYLKENHPNFIRKLRTSLVEKVYAHHALIDIRNKLENEKPVIVNGFFCKNALHDGTLRLCSNVQIQQKLRSGRTKVQILLQPYMEVQALCTVLRHGSDYIELLVNSSSVNLLAENGGKYTAQMYPNFEQNRYALNGIRGIAGDERMLKKFYAFDEMDIIEGPKIQELSYANFISIISSLVEKSERTLVCSPSSGCIKNITMELQKVASGTCSFEYGHAAKTDITHKSNSHLQLSKCTVEFSKVSAKKLKSFKLVICGLEHASKLVDQNLSNQHFNNIFMCSAHLISEMNAWTVLGKLANINTKIFICANSDGRGVKTSTVILQHDEIGYYKSIFERLCGLSGYSHSEDGDPERITVIEL